MKILCTVDVKRKDLPREICGNKVNKVVFKKGKKYELIPHPFTKSTLQYIEILAIGEDGKPHIILYDELHFNKTTFALDNFDFSPADKLAKKIEN